jgi:hypothetical protein
LRRTSKYASLLRISGALHPGIFDQPAKDEFFNGLIRVDPFGGGKPPTFICEEVEKKSKKKSKKLTFHW